MAIGNYFFRTGLSLWIGVFFLVCSESFVYANFFQQSALRFEILGDRIPASLKKELLAIRSESALKSLKAFLDAGYPPTERLIQVSSQINHPSGAEAAQAIAQKGGTLNFDKLSGLKNIQSNEALHCVTAFTRNGYKIASPDAGNALEVCAHANHPVGVMAVQEITQTRKSLSGDAIRIAVGMRNEHALRALRALMRAGYSPLDWIVQAMSNIGHPYGAQAAEIIASAGGALNQARLDLLGRIQTAEAFSCMKAFVSKGYKIASPESGNALEVCTQANHPVGVMAVQELTQTGKSISGEAARIAVGFRSEHAVQALRALMRTGYSPLDWTVQAMSNISHPYGAQAAEVIASAGGSLSQARLDLLGRIQTAEAFNCVKAFISRGYKIASPESGNALEVCTQANQPFGVMAVQELTASGKSLPGEAVQMAVGFRSEQSVQALRAFMRAGYSPVAWLVGLCGQVSKNSELALAQRAASRGGTIELDRLRSEIFGPRVDPAPQLTQAEVRGSERQRLLSEELSSEQIAEMVQVSEALAKLSIDQLSVRDPSQYDSLYYPEMIRDLRSSTSPALTSSIKEEVMKQILFEKALFESRQAFLRKAGREELKVWTYHEGGAHGAFHAERALENTRWRNPGSEKLLPIKNKLNYVHNVLLKTYLMAKQENQLERFFLEAFDIARYCIDARAEAMVNYLVALSTQLEDFRSIEDFYQNEVKKHMVQCQSAGVEMTAASLNQLPTWGESTREKSSVRALLNKRLRLHEKSVSWILRLG